MITRTYNEFNAEVMAHYAKQEFATVYEMLTRDGAEYPDHEPEVLYLRSCMAARIGDHNLSMDLIQDALDRGYWYGEEIMRRSPSWADLQGLPRFEQLVAACVARTAGVEAMLYVEEPDDGCAPEQGCPVLFALHGNGANAQQSLDGWKPVVGRGWLLAAAQSSQAGMTGVYIWDNQEKALEEIHKHFATLRDGHRIDPSRVILAGFSMGGETALRAALLGTIPAHGFVLLGPGGPTIDTPQEWLPLIEGAKGRDLRGYVFLGGDDDTVPHDQIRAIVALLNEHGVPCELEDVPGIAHEFPNDFGPRIERALAFVLRQES